MIDYQTVQGTQDVKPPEYELCGDVVFIRHDIRRITNRDGVEMWEYEEAKVSLSEFTVSFVQEMINVKEDQQAQIDYIAMMSNVDMDDE